MGKQHPRDGNNAQRRNNNMIVTTCCDLLGGLDIAILGDEEAGKDLEDQVGMVTHADKYPAPMHTPHTLSYALLSAFIKNKIRAGTHFSFQPAP